MKRQKHIIVNYGVFNRIDICKLKDKKRHRQFNKNLISNFLKWNQKAMVNRLINFLVNQGKKNKM